MTSNCGGTWLLVNMLQGRASIQIGGMGQEEPYEIQHRKCKVLHVGRNNDIGVVGVQLCWKRSEGLGRQQAAHEPVVSLGSKDDLQRQGKQSSPSTHQFDITSSYCLQFEIFQYKTDVDQLKQVQQRAAKMVGGWTTCPVRKGWGHGACSAWRSSSIKGTW